VTVATKEAKKGPGSGILLLETSQLFMVRPHVKGIDPFSGPFDF
jgi:hypothetical protein